jgi:general secretion pathway protein F
MPLYEYKAYNVSGGRVSGLVDAPSRGSAYSKLKKQGLFPSEMAEESGGGTRAPVPSSELIFALDQMATLLRAGVPLPETLDTLSQQVGNESLKRGLTKVKVHLEEGESLAGALAEEGVFPPVLVKMVEAAESVGTVDLIMERYSQFLEKESAFREKVISSMMYPSIVMVASIGLILFILTYIAPTLVQVFSSFKTDLPLPTKVLLWVGSFLKSNFALLFTLFFVAILTYTRLVPRSLKDALLLRLPVVGEIHRYVQMSRWAKTLSMLHGGGVSLIKALSSAREVIENVEMNTHFKAMEDYIQKGQGLGAALSRIPGVPPIMVQMTKSGEKSGELERMLNTAANFYEKEVDRKLTMFFKFLEPAAIMILGGVVGFVVLSALLPIFEINRLIK